MKRIATGCLLMFIVVSLQAQKKSPTANTPAKKPLTHDVYDSWKEIPYKAVTNDGQVVVLTVNPQDGDGKIIFHHLKSNQQDSVHRGAEIGLTFDSQHAAFKIKPVQKVVKDLRRQKKKKEDLPKDTLGIYTFSSKKLEKIPEVKTYKIPEKAGGWIAYQLEAKKEVKPKAKADPEKKENKPKK